MHSRFLAMGIALAPSLPGGPLRRAVEGQAVVDPRGRWPTAATAPSTASCCSAPPSRSTLAWLAGTVAGALAGDLIGDVERFGLDALFPTFFIGILIAELGEPRARVAAALGAAIALALVPFAPPGVPVLVASAAALVGLGAVREDDGGRVNLERGPGLAADRRAGR